MYSRTSEERPRSEPVKSDRFSEVAVLRRFSKGKLNHSVLAEYGRSSEVVALRRWPLIEVRLYIERCAWNQIT